MARAVSVPSLVYGTRSRSTPSLASSHLAAGSRLRSYAPPSSWSCLTSLSWMYPCPRGGFAPSPLELIVARASQWVAASIVAPSVLSLITTTFPQGAGRNRALGTFGAVASAGFASGVILGGLLTSAFGWRWVLFVNVPIGL